ncbi:MAG: ribonuclease PH [Planctomycetota bacterium]
MQRTQREHDQIRPLTFQRGYTDNPGGSVLVRWGATYVLCTAMIEEGVPTFLKDSGSGWLTAEYSMLPGSTPTRRTRDVARGRPDGRSSEIQRLIGRSLRAGADLSLLPGRTLYVDCDVLQADGGTRTASINGAWLAAHDAVSRALESGALASSPLLTKVAAVSVGIVEGMPVLDLEAREDQAAEVDMNIVMTGEGEYIEVQGSAEKGTFSPAMLERLLDLAREGIRQVTLAQARSLESPE